MSAVGEAKIIISADDRTGSAFASLERRVKGLGTVTKSVGEAAGSIGKISGEVDKVSGAVARAITSVNRYDGALRSLDGSATSIGKIAVSVDRAAASMPRLTGDANAMAKAMKGVAEAERMVATETDRISKAGSKLSLFKALQGDFRAARSTFNVARADLAGLAKDMEANEMRANALRQRRDIAAAAEARARTAYNANPVPGRGDAADKAKFDAMVASRAEAAKVLNAAEKERRALSASLAEAEDGSEAKRLRRRYGDAQKAAALSSAALDMQKSALRETRSEFEALAGPLTTISGAEKRLVADAEAATRAFQEQARAAGAVASATETAIRREEAAFARAAEGRARWARDFAALDARTGGQRGALAGRRLLTAVETLRDAMHRPAQEPPHSAAAREVADLADAKLRLNAFREMQEGTAELRRAAREAQAEAARVGRDVRASGAPSPELLSAHAEAQGHASVATRAFEAQASTLGRLKGEIEQVLGPMRSLASAEQQLAKRAEGAESTMRRQEARHRRFHAVRDMAENVLPFEGPEVLHLTREAAHEGAMLQHERVGLQNAGRTPEEIHEIEKRSLQVSGDLPTATMEENMKVVAETTPAFGSLDHALEHLEFMQKTMAALKAAGGEHIKGGVGDVGRDFAKFFEDRLTKPEEFEAQAARMIPAMVASGGVFNPHEMMMFGQQAHSALAGFDTDFIADYAPSMVLAHGGAKAGTAASAYTNVIMGKANDKKQAKMWEDLGLLDMSKAITKNGAAVSWTAGAIKNTNLALENPVRWAEEVAIPAMQAKGYDTSNRLEVQKVLATMFRNQMANQFANDIMQPASLARMHKDKGIYHRVGALDDIYRRNLHEDVTFALPALGETLKSFASIVTSPIMKDAADMIGSTAEQLGHLGTALGKWNEEHPQAAKAIAGGALTGGLAVGGLLTGMLFTNLKGLLSGGASTAAAGEMVAAGGMQVRAGEMMLAAAGKGSGPGGLPGGGAPGEGPGGGPGGGPGTKPGASPGYASLIWRGIMTAFNLGSAAAGAPNPATPEGQKAMAQTDQQIAAFNKRASEATGGFFPAEDDPNKDLAMQGRTAIKALWGRIFGSSGPAAAPALPSFVDMPLPPARPVEMPWSRPGLTPAPVSGLPAHALPSAAAVLGAPVPVAIVSTPASLPPPIPDRWLDGGRAGIEERSRRGRDDFLRDHEGAVGQRMMEHAAPLSDLKAIVEGPITAQVTGNAEVSVTVRVEPTSALLQVVASAGKASMPLTSGGSTGGVGVQRTSANPQYGTNGGSGRGPR